MRRWTGRGSAGRPRTGCGGTTSTGTPTTHGVRWIQDDVAGSAGARHEPVIESDVPGGPPPPTGHPGRVAVEADHPLPRLARLSHLDGIAGPSPWLERRQTRPALPRAQAGDASPSDDESQRCETMNGKIVLVSPTAVQRVGNIDACMQQMGGLGCGAARRRLRGLMLVIKHLMTLMEGNFQHRGATHMHVEPALGWSAPTVGCTASGTSPARAVQCFPPTDVRSLMKRPADAGHDSGTAP